jgi:hypothetical protein
VPGARDARIAAVAGSAGLHALVVLVVMQTEWSRPPDLPMRPLEAFVLREPWPPIEPAFEPAVEPALAPAPPSDAGEAEPAVAAATPPETESGPEGAELPADDDEVSAAEDEAPAPDVDWGARIPEAVVYLRQETERERRYRGFGYPAYPQTLPESSSSVPSVPTGRPPPSREVPLATTPQAEGGLSFAGSCYTADHHPASTLGNMYRLTSAGVYCRGRTRPAEVRDDLFEDIKPDYLR